ncbi:MaoC/PaaZ C-terminal domain-containing protein [Streptomyces sp. NPDC002463]|uniref:MaoC/PaaZ C-terminal domain-containing protein n=1 Tax=Streptomyces sp. NPDC002463 TaxID=3364645 RepID=UPI0036B8F08B
MGVREASTEAGRLYAEDIEQFVDLRQPLGTHMMTEDDIREFAGHGDPLPIHVGDGEHFGGVIASGLHTLCVHQRLAVAGPYSRWAVAAGRRMTSMSLPRSVRPGDTLTGWVTVAQVSPRVRTAVARIHGELINQNGDQVLSLELEAVVKNHPTATSDRSR